MKQKFSKTKMTMQMMMKTKRMNLINCSIDFIMEININKNKKKIMNQSPKIINLKNRENKAFHKEPFTLQVYQLLQVLDLMVKNMCKLINLIQWLKEELMDNK